MLCFIIIHLAVKEIATTDWQWQKIIVKTISQHYNNFTTVNNFNPVMF